MPGVNMDFAATQKLLDPASTSTENISDKDITIDMLDYAWINETKDKDIPLLEKVVEILRSGKEGHYPHLTTSAEDRLRMLAPQSRTLRNFDDHEIPLTRDQRDSLNEDMASWLNTIHSTDKSLRQQDINHANDVPPVRCAGAVVEVFSGKKEKEPTKSENKKTAKTKKQRIKSHDFKSWDKYVANDLDADLEDDSDSDNGIELETKTESQIMHEPPPTPINVTSADVPKSLTASSLASLTETERGIHSELERKKGNEHFKLDEYVEANIYYTRSIEMKETVAALNNRSLVCLRLKRFESALDDASRVIELEPDNVKAWVRRGTASKELKHTADAIADFRHALILEPNNKGVKTLLRELECEGKTNTTIENSVNSMVANEKNVKKKRMVIEEVEDDDGNDIMEDDGSSKIKVQLEAAKLRGNDFFRLGQYADAITVYSEAIDSVATATPAVLAATIDVRRNLLNNRSACYSKMGSFRGCIGDCTSVLVDEPKNIKALIRRAHAYEGLERIQEAYDDMKSVLKLDPSIWMASEACLRLDKIRRKINKDSLKTNETDVVASAPKSYFEFVQVWRQLRKSSDAWTRYVHESLSATNLSKLFSSSFESDILADIVKTRPDKNILRALTEVRRFDMAAMFLNEEDKNIVSEILCDDNCRDIREKFGV